jgi:hypothetical protein
MRLNNPATLAGAAEQLRGHLRIDAQLGRQQTLAAHLLTFYSAFPLP